MFSVLQVIGVPDERLGEEVCAWVRLKDNVEATAEEIKQFCKGKVPHHFAYGLRRLF